MISIITQHENIHDKSFPWRIYNKFSNKQEWINLLISSLLEFRPAAKKIRKQCAKEIHKQ